MFCTDTLATFPTEEQLREFAKNVYESHVLVFCLCSCVMIVRVEKLDFHKTNQRQDRGGVRTRSSYVTPRALKVSHLYESRVTAIRKDKHARQVKVRPFKKAL